jgi:hypothetical protein
MLNRLVPLSVEESGRYIVHRLRVAGYLGGPRFDAPALKAIAQFSAGIPRNINNCCFNALSLGFALGRKVVDLSVVGEVIHDLDISKHVSDNAVSANPAAERHVRSSASKVDANSMAEITGASKIGSEAVATTAIPEGNHERTGALTPAEAIAYMQQLSLQLRGWKRGSSLGAEVLGARLKPGILG